MLLALQVGIMDGICTLLALLVSTCCGPCMFVMVRPGMEPLAEALQSTGVFQALCDAR